MAPANGDAARARLVTILDELTGLGYKNRDVAAELGIVSGHLSNIKNGVGRSRMTLPLAKKLESRFGYSSEWLLRGVGDMKAAEESVNYSLDTAPPPEYGARLPNSQETGDQPEQRGEHVYHRVNLNAPFRELTHPYKPVPFTVYLCGYCRTEIHKGALACSRCLAEADWGGEPGSGEVGSDTESGPGDSTDG